MRLKIPVTGTVIDYDPKLVKLGGIGISGDPNDPVRPIPIDLGNVSWRSVRLDIDDEVMEIEVTPDNEITEPDPVGVDGEGNPLYKLRSATEQEKTGFLEYALNQVETRTKDELYQIYNCPRLKWSVQVLK